MKLTNSWIIGFADGDGCLSVSTQEKYPNTDCKDVFYRHSFIISQNKRSIDVLYSLKETLNCGNVHKSGKGTFEFKVGNQEDLKIILSFLDQNPFQTDKKQFEYEIFRSSVLAYLSRDRKLGMPQITIQAFESLKDNKLSFQERQKLHISLQHDDALLVDLLDEEKAQKEQQDAYDFLQQQVRKPISLNREWLAGFIDADGCFSCSFTEEYPRPQLLIAADLRELTLFNVIKETFKCGNVRLRKKENGSRYAIFQVSSVKEFQDVLFPLLFTKGNSPLLKTVKRHTLEKFRQIVNLIILKKHLNEEGKEKIIQLRSLLNKKKSVDES